VTKDRRIQQPSLVRMAAETIREMVLSGELRPGDRLVEERLTEELGISRPPLREALRLLEQEGLLLSMPRRGVIVTPLSAQDVYEIFTLRTTYERMAIELGVPCKDPELLARYLGVEAQSHQQRRELLGIAAAQQQGHLDAVWRDRRHDRAFDVATAAAVDQISRTTLGPRRCRIEVQEPGSSLQCWRASLRDRYGLARGDGGNDEVGLRGEIEMRSRQRDAMGRRMIAQGAGLIVAELEVIGGDPDVLPAQIFGENAAHFAITDEAYIPVPGVGRHLGHFETISIGCPVSNYRFLAVTAFECRPSRSPSATCRCRN